nr:MAG TPA: hypothetical protein [Caudoviricetes sp.]
MVNFSTFRGEDYKILSPFFLLGGVYYGNK